MNPSRVLFLISGLALAAAADKPVAPYESSAAIAPHGRIDELAFARFEQIGLQPANPCSDEVFPRRVYLDAIGTQPKPEEAMQFLHDQDPGKRNALIARLLDRPEFADYWALKWSDLLRVKSEFPINLWPNAVQAYYRWIHSAVKDNIPYDRFATELLVSSGSNFRDPQVNFYRALQSREPRAVAQAVALTFMGTRAETWPKEKLDAMAAFFSRIGYKNTGEWKEEIVYFDPAKPCAARSRLPGRQARAPGSRAGSARGVRRMADRSG